MKEKVLPVLLAAALVGSACQRQPESPQSPPITEPAGTIKPINPGQILAEKPRGGAARPAEAQKSSSSAGGERVTIRLKPEELSRALLTTPLENNELPTGFTSKNHLVLVPTPTEKTLNALRKINVGIETTQRSVSAGIYYTVFSDNRDAKGLYNTMTTLSTNPVSLEKEFSYPASLIRYPTGLAIFAVVDSTLVETLAITAPGSTGNQSNINEREIIVLAKAAIAHLQRVGR